MNYQLILRGVTTKPIIVSAAHAHQLGKHWSEPGNERDPAKVVDVTGREHMILIGDIKAISPHNDPSVREQAEKDQRSADTKAYFEQTDADYEKYRRGILALPLEKRAGRMQLAEIVWYAATGQIEIPADVREEIVKRQLDFFKAKPNRCFADPTCYRDVIEPRTVPTRHHEGMHIGNMIPRSAMSFVERIVAADMLFTRRGK